MNYPGHAWYRFNALLVLVVGIGALVYGKVAIGIGLVVAGALFLGMSEKLLPVLAARRRNR